MERPSLTPITHSDFEKPLRRWWHGWLPPMRQLPAFSCALVFRSIIGSARLTWWLFRRSRRLLLTDLRSDGGTRHVLPFRRAAAGMMLHSLWLPIGLSVASVVLVHRGTHPEPLGPSEPTRLGGIFSERVSITAEDGVELSALWIPAVTPSQVITERDALLRQGKAAVVLVHDHGEDARQMLPAARALHEAGLNVLVLETRGAGHSEDAARTFGELESLDVAAAVEHLRSRPSVDSSRIAGWGVGYGALALEQAQLTAPLALLVSENGPSEEIDTRFVPPGMVFDPARPVCRWAFALLYNGSPTPRPSNPPLRSVEARGVAGATAELLSTFSHQLTDAR